MQRPDEKKRALITATAARLFATHPYHKVRLDDIAAAAKIGKGTLYIYFENKEDLYSSLIFDGFARLIDRLREPDGDGAAGLSALQGLRRIVGELVGFAFQHPHFFELMRSPGMPKGFNNAAWQRRRGELYQLIADTLRAGVAAGELIDPHPELTALFIPGMVRSAMLFGPKGVDEVIVRDQILRLLEGGIRKTKSARNEDIE